MTAHVQQSQHFNSSNDRETRRRVHAIWKLAVAHGLAIGAFEVNWVIVLAFVFTETGSASRSALMLAAGAVVAAIVAPVAGWVVDRYDRKAVLIASRLGFAVVVALASIHPSVLVIVIAYLINEIPAVTQSSAHHAAIPNLAPKDRLAWANATVGAVMRMFALGAPIAGAWFVAASDIAIGLQATAGIMVLSTVFVAAIGVPFSEDDSGDDDDADKSVSAGAQFVRRDGFLRRLLIAWFLMNLSFGMLISVELPLAIAVGSDEFGYALLMSSFSLGTIVGGLVAARVLGDDGLVRWLVLGSAGCAAAFIASSVSPSIEPIIALNLVLGVLMAFVMAADQTLMQQRTPDAVRGRVGAAFGVALIMAFAIGAGTGGLLVDTLGARAAYGLAGVMQIPTALLFVRAGRALRALPCAAPDRSGNASGSDRFARPKSAPAATGTDDEPGYMSTR